MHPNSPPASSPIAVCTLWEGDYHKGLGALVNSLVRVGFTGNIWAAYRGSLPSWAKGGIADGPRYTIEVAPGVRLVFVHLDTQEHFSHYKPVWCAEVLENLDPTAAGLYYFDPDIFLLTRWSFFEEWITFGIASCEDTHLPLNPTHPIVHRWGAFAASIGLAPHRPVESCQNSGLIGLRREHISFLADWRSVLTHAQSAFSLAKDLKSGTRADMFHNVDQDAFNVTLMATPHPISRIGLDGMAFARGEWLTLHAVGAKPWRRKVLRDLVLEGAVPDTALRLYWSHAATPLAVESTASRRWHRFTIPLAALVGRFYRRG